MDPEALERAREEGAEAERDKIVKELERVCESAFVVVFDLGRLTQLRYDSGRLEPAPPPPARSTSITTPRPAAVPVNGEVPKLKAGARRMLKALAQRAPIKPLIGAVLPRPAQFDILLLIGETKNSACFPYAPDIAIGSQVVNLGQAGVTRSLSHFVKNLGVANWAARPS